MRLGGQKPTRQMVDADQRTLGRLLRFAVKV